MRELEASERKLTTEQDILRKPAGRSQCPRSATTPDDLRTRHGVKHPDFTLTSGLPERADAFRAQAMRCLRAVQ
ncbi:hypothetical protein [Nonomuraea basaltis]|uniref:hypothetical protein n=1 Tax=Nonomuraea basaltis TaxID=2495887 RepID=UPI00110C4C39|nr:hypothetical protein [Nonomuraea basaltis]TMR91876.1 hypothetical protein EJK15_47770 [Nonomuraea basaltis]